MNKLQAIYRKDRHISRLVIMIVAWMIFMAITRFSKFYTVINFTTMASQFPEFGIMALGGMLCMITGGIDLSSVGVANVTSITMGMFMKSRMVDGSINVFTMIAAFAMAICIGLVVGAINGVLISKIKSCTDSEARYAMMHIAEDLLMQTGCITPLYFYTDIYMIDDSVKGFYSNPLGYKYFMHCTIEK